ncbi:nicotinate-nucleotide--dimethylbenzimidazole phosphoribosyltransferase [Kineococcus rubinsiae]|uniref:nicotinate-nucleotide--dimethylbenzimidazole phosphoribosyltransferase n=1 Tax=Kineococcus rubinsiae TaxID=2609562 RepID=UPI00142FD4F1|nr:nicotinate-nucleotide--dimethylbenzimidazole phosphoribosyltransferase [Kineococcus rubinsiae]NIZ92512.1 nicotinate-nucleotide--dimethylbenzimidazole phosphoribosyltransferase [Kineococcus rubinsiae]
MSDGPPPLNLRELAEGLSSPRQQTAPPRVDAPLLADSRLETVGRWLASTQDRDVPAPLDRVRLVVFAGDHGVAHADVSRLAPGTTADAVRALVQGRGPTASLAALHGVGVAVHAVGVDDDLSDLPAAVTAHAVRRGSGDVRVEDAMTLAETETALRAGAAVADAEIDAGVDLLVLGDLGVGATTVAAVLVAACLRKGAVEVVGRGSGVDDAAWMRKTAAIRDAVRRSRRHATRPTVLLQTVGSADTAAAVGFLLRAAARRTPVLLDGVVSVAAALVASRGVPGVESWWALAARSAEPALVLGAERTKLVPLLDLGAGRGGGTAALTALPVLRAAQALAASDAADAPPAPEPEPEPEPVAGSAQEEEATSVHADEVAAVEVLPVEVVAVEVVPVEVAPGERVLEERVPDERVPDERVPDDLDRDEAAPQAGASPSAANERPST